MSRPQRDTVGCAQWPASGRTVVFLGISPLFYRSVLQPVAESLAMANDLNVLVIWGPSGHPREVMGSGRVMFQSIGQHWDVTVGTRTKEMIEHLHLAKKTILHSWQLAHIIYQEGSGLTWPAMLREVNWLFWREFRRLIPQMAVAEHILGCHRPALIVSADDADQRCRIYSLLGRSFGIPSLVVQQGFTTAEYPDWRFFSADAVAVMSENQRDGIISQGVPPDRITVTGHPGFDSLVSLDPDTSSRTRVALRVGDGHSMLLFASGPYVIGSRSFSGPNVRRTMIRAVCEAAEAVESSYLVVKPHPSENVRELRSLVGRRQRLLIVDKMGDITPLIKACDVFITFFSQSGLQALVAGKPVINVAFPGSGTSTAYSDSGATWLARSRDEIERHIHSLTGENRAEEMAKRAAARQRFVYEWTHLPDGRATERVVAAIRNMLDTNDVIAPKHENSH